MLYPDEYKKFTPSDEIYQRLVIDTVMSMATTIRRKLVTFNLNVAPAGSYRLKLYNGGGSVVATIFSGSLAEGKCSIIANVSAISAGSYTYKLVDGSDNVINSQTGAVTIP